jgi:hypothetical protein
MRGKAETPRATAVRGERGGEGKGPTRKYAAWGTRGISERPHAQRRRMGHAADKAKTPRGRAAHGVRGGRREDAWGRQRRPSREG